ncbi:hypothetical protein QP185_18310 [Sphingomonas aerolata]|uniref:hypothetical protein n=1 Tax=Sphingomonas aerolata TaxID=185951 RepID=UPI002FE23AB0
MLETFWVHMRAKRLLPEPLTVLSITNGLIDAFIAWRSGQGCRRQRSLRDIAALRGPINWGMKNNHLTAAPRIKEVKGRKKRKELEWSPEQVAAILDAAAADEQRRHIHLFAMINLSTHGRTEAILELDADTQIRQGLIYFLRPDEEQTRKRRAIVPICPTLAALARRFDRQGHPVSHTDASEDACGGWTGMVRAADSEHRERVRRRVARRQCRAAKSRFGTSGGRCGRQAGMVGAAQEAGRDQA